VLLVAGAEAAPPPPPGGHLPLHYGGDNTAGYPQLQLSGSEGPEADAVPSRLTVVAVPNPFARSTAVTFVARRDEPLHLRIYSTAGRLVREVSGVAPQSGAQALAWDGRDGAGKTVPAGIYFYSLRAGIRTASGRLVFMR
jgi:hypothetical protein